MQQIIHIHGWNCFPSQEALCETLKNWDYDPFAEEQRKRWRDWLKEELISTHQMIMPVMPNSNFAYYQAWKIWFEKIFPYLNDEWVILIGHSLGWMFLLKYLTENHIPVKVSQLHLVSACLDETGLSADDSYLWDFIFDTDKIPVISQRIKDIYIYHSKDDKTVPYSHSVRLSKYLPQAKFMLFEDRGHFRWDTFPELKEGIENIG